MRTNHRIAGILRIPVASLLAVSLSLITAGLPASRVNAQTPQAQGDAASGGSPCLQELNDQKAKTADADAKPAKAKGPGWLSRNANIVMGGIGAAGGVLIGSKVCKDETSERRAQCRMIGGLGGAFLGSKLGKMLSEAEQKRYQEAAYKVALTGRPQSLTLEKGCMVVEAKSDETFEERQVELAFGSGVTTPQKLRAVAIPHVRQSSANVAVEPASSQGSSKVDANVPLFVMGSTDAGKWLLLGREDPDQGFVGAGYVDAKGWAAAPDSTPALIADAGGQMKLATVGVEVPCRQISSSIRVESSNKQETYPGRICRLPNGISESQ